MRSEDIIIGFLIAICHLTKFQISRASPWPRRGTCCTPIWSWSPWAKTFWPRTGTHYHPRQSLKVSSRLAQPSEIVQDLHPPLRQEPLLLILQVLLNLQKRQKAAPVDLWLVHKWWTENLWGINGDKINIPPTSSLGHGCRADFLQTVFRRVSYENLGQNRVFVALK